MMRSKKAPANTLSTSGLAYFTTKARLDRAFYPEEVVFCAKQDLKADPMISKIMMQKKNFPYYVMRHANALEFPVSSKLVELTEDEFSVQNST